MDMGVGAYERGHQTTYTIKRLRLFKVNLGTWCRGDELFALLELIRIADRRKVTQIQIKLFKLVSVNCFSFQLR
jgi:hypothetical protein